MRILVYVISVSILSVGILGSSNSHNNPDPLEIIQEENINSGLTTLSGEQWEETQELYNQLAKKTLEKYKDNSIVLNEFFDEKPEDFIFPEEMPEITFYRNEMTYFVGKINSADNKYEMWFSIDDIKFEGVVREDIPKVDGVMFDITS